MKRNIRIAVAALMLAMMASPTMAKVKTAKFNVNGRCARCGQRIETAAKAVDGVQTAQWDEVSKEMVVTFSKISPMAEKTYCKVYMMELYG